MKIFPKVGLNDIFFVKSRDKGEYSRYHNKIARKHVDFLLCDPGRLTPVMGIELDDFSHRRPQREQRDILMEEVFNSAGLPLVRFDNKKQYSINEIKERIEGSLVTGDTSGETQEESSAEESPLCPKCNVPHGNEECFERGEKRTEVLGMSEFSQVQGNCCY